MMKKSRLLNFAVLIISIFFARSVFGAGGDMGAGTEPLTDGSAAYPYLIEDLNDFDEFASDSSYWDDHISLKADIDLIGRTYTTAVIASDTDATTHNFQGTSFSGVFDGEKHTISNFTCDSNGIDYIGLFGYVSGSGAEIKNIKLIDPNVDAGTGDYVGSLVGFVYTGGSITGCKSVGGSVSGINNIGGLVGRMSAWNPGDSIVSDSYATTFVSGNYYVGGLVGYNYSGTVIKCYATGSVSGDQFVSGLVGLNSSGTVSDSYATGIISGVFNVGGLVGTNSSGTVSECYATGSVSGFWRIGGLLGVNAGTVNNSYSVGASNGTQYVGGLIGRNYFGTVSYSYSAGDVDGVTNVGGLVGYDEDGLGDYTKSFWDGTVNPDVNGIGNGNDPNVIGESTANMQIASTYTDANWDFTIPIWAICEGMDYPRFWWEKNTVAAVGPQMIRT